MTTADSIDVISRLLAPRSVAVIGASADPGKTAGKPVAYLLQQRFKGEIWPVNPRVESIAGLTCYPDIPSLPRAPDVGLVLVGTDRARGAVAELAALGTPAAIVLASGYGESGEDGRNRQAALRSAAGSMRLLGPNTMGLVNLTDGIPLSPSGALVMERFPVGHVAVVSQSGGILGSLLSRGAARGIGMSKLVSTGNEADLELADFVAYLAADDATKVIVLYIEAIRDPDRFRRAARLAAAAGKPIVAYKVGRSEAGAKAAVSHTGAMAGSDRMYDALFRSVGVIRVQSFSDLLDVPAVLSTGRSLKGRRVAILTSTGGAGTLVSDALGVSGFETPAPDRETADRLRALMPGDQAVLDRNPIDVTLAGLQPEILRGAVATLLDSPTYDALTIIVGSSGVGRPDLMADAVQASLSRSDKPVIGYVSPHAPQAAALLTARGVPAFAAPESCAVAFDALSRARPGIERRAGKDRREVDLSGLRAGSLDEAQSKSLFARFGIAHAPECIVGSEEEAEEAARSLGGMVALKLLSAEITHKSDVGGVVLGLTPQTIGSALAGMVARVAEATGQRPERFLVQAMIAGGVEMIIGLRRDPLGAAILVGMGGVTAELFNDTALRMLDPEVPLSRDEVSAMLRELRSWPLLDGYRGRPKADVDALVSAIVAFSDMAAMLGPRLLEAEINPLFVLPQGQGAVAADGVAVLGPEEIQ